MKKLTCCFVCIFLLIGTVAAQDKEVKLKIVQTSDIHGNFYPRDFILQRDAVGSLARVYAFVQKERETYKDNLILLDNGDILQGQPTAYYYNYIDTVSPHVAAEMLNFMGYNAGNMGNHDVETGRAVFDRWAGDCHAPVLGANIIETATGKTHFPPYVTLERDGVRIVVLGMITPAIPVWLSENLWKGLRFDDMEETARKWMKIIREKERPDIVIGMFHAGQDALLMGGKYRENASLDVARNVPGFDIVLMGHDHARECKKVRNIAGDSVLVIDPASNGVVVSDIDITVTLRDGKVTDKKIDGVLTETGAYGVYETFRVTVRHHSGFRIEEDRAFHGNHLHPSRLFRFVRLHRPYPYLAAEYQRRRDFAGRPSVIRHPDKGRGRLRVRYVQPVQVRKHALHHEALG